MRHIMGYSPALLFTLFCALLSACSQPSSKTSRTPETSQLDIPYTRYTLENGLTLIVHEDHSDPIAHIDVTYHVGSAREEPGRSGFAHLFEHMMFQGSEHVADEEHFKIINEAGGQANGSTSQDRTNYYETVPSNYLETMLWLEADRMGFFLNGITQEKFEIQRATVKNEKKQNYGNRAYGRVYELTDKALYPQTHPYHWPTIGETEDLNNATYEDLRNFFLRWYSPNNATITVGGDVDTQDVLRLTKKYFGSIPKGPSVTDLTPSVPTLEANRYISYVDKNIRFPGLRITIPTIPSSHPDEAALQCLGDIMGGGKTSYLYQQFIATGKAMHLTSYNSSNELSGEFSFFALPFPNSNLTQFESELNTSLQQFTEDNITDQAIAKYKAGYEARFIHKLENVSGKVTRLAYNQTIHNDANHYKTIINNVMNLTADDVRRVYREYIQNKPAVILSVLSDENQQPAQADTFDALGLKPLTADPLKQEHKLSYTHPVDNFDRSKKPQPSEAKLAPPPNYWKHTLSNGMKVIATQTDELPITTLRLSLPGGGSADAVNMDKLGLSALTINLMNGATENYSEKDMSEALEQLGSSISFSSDDLRFHIVATTLTKNIDKTLVLLEEKLLRPAFLKNEFDVKKNQLIESVKSGTQDAGSTATQVFDTLLFGRNHVLGTTNADALPKIESLTLTDVKHFYQQFITPTNSELVVVGNLNKKSILKKITFLTDWEKAKQPEIALPKTPTHDKTTIYYVHKDSAEQAELRIGYLNDFVYEPTGDYYQCFLMNYIFGGNFNSRININLREDKGITYGIRSYCGAAEIPQPFAISGSVTTDKSSLAIRELLNEIERYKNEAISTDELSYLQNSIAQSDALKYESSSAKANLLGNILRFDIPKDFTQERQKIISELTQERIQGLANTFLHEDHMIIVLVGNKDIFLPELKNLGLPLVELDENGEVVTY